MKQLATLLLAIVPTAVSLSLPLGPEKATSRRNLLSSGLASAAFLSSKQAQAQASTKPLASIPMVRLKLPQAGFGREYIAMQLKVDGQPYDFMVDTGLTTEMITPHLQSILDIQSNKKLQGLGAGGATESSLVTLQDVALCCGDFASGNELKLPNLRAVIADFPQEHIDPAHDPVEGMIGMELLSQFDVDFDFQNNRIRFWEPGTVDTTGLVEIPAVVINETGLIGVRIAVPGQNERQPILGFLDCGSTFSCINWKGAQLLGLPPQNDDKSYKKNPSIAAVGIDGRPLLLPTYKQQLTFAGEIQMDPKTNRPIGFQPPPANWKPWDSVLLAVGDIPAFSSILGDGRTPYQGPAALIGLDVLAQRGRVVFETGKAGSRRRRLYVSPS